MYLVILFAVWAYGGEYLKPLDELHCYGNKLIGGRLGYEGQVELTVKEARVSIGGLITFNTRAYHIRNEDDELIPKVPGPTIIVKQGHTCVVKLINELPNVGNEGCINNTVNGTLQQGYQCSDTTNIHTHGLWISPWQDYIGSYAQPGQSFTFNYSIAIEHMPGTFWYHAHHHGSTMLNIAGGQAGALIVEPNSGYSEYFMNDRVLTELYEDAKLLLMFHAFFGGNDDVRGYSKITEKFWMADYVGVATNYANVTVEPHVTFEDPYINDTYTVNNQYQPVVNFSENHVQLLRFVHASGVRILNLIVDPDKDSNKTCELKLIARDGIFQYKPYKDISSIFLIQGTRADVAFKCPAGTYNVRTEPNAAFCNITGASNMYIQETVFTLQVYVDADKSDKPESQFPTTEVQFPWYLKNACSTINFSQPYGYYEQRTLKFKNDGYGFDFVGKIGSKPFHGFGFEGIRNEIKNLPYKLNPWTERYCLNQQYDINFYGNPEEIFKEYSCGANVTREAIDQAISLNQTCLQNSGKKGMHPYHQHVNPFQVLWYDQGNDVAPDVVARHCEWRDTIPASEDIHIQFTPRVFTGDVIVHCHLIQHEDHGMMGFYDITNDAAYCKGKLPTLPTPSPTLLTESSTVPTGVPTSDGPDFKDTLWIINGVLTGLVIILLLCTLVMCCYFRAHIKGRHSFSNDSSEDSIPIVKSSSDKNIDLELVVQRVGVTKKPQEC